MEQKQLSSNTVVGWNDENINTDKLLLTDTQVSKLFKVLQIFL